MTRSQSIDRPGPASRPSPTDRSIALWLLCLCALVFAMVLLGGYTRLTQSGLSMTDWRPVTGLLPPLGPEAWQAEFARYQQFPEFQKLNKWMDVTAFQSIYLVEYSHRLLGRVIGLMFALPFVYFLARGRITRSMLPRLLLMFVLGGLQGGFGWWMVKSGLIDRPDVSHYRLTAHLGLAVAIYGYMLWVAMGLLAGRVSRSIKADSGSLAGLATAVCALVVLQILSGGLVAGLDAGHAYNSWPLIDGALIPSGLFAQAPWIVNPFENILTVQFDHRMLAYVVFALAGLLWWRGRTGEWAVRRATVVVAGLMVTQLALGIATLLHSVPLTLGVLHQAGALMVFTAALHAVFVLRRGWPQREAR